MSRSIHITKRNFKGLTVKELDEQKKDIDSDLVQWSKKFSIKKHAGGNRKWKAHSFTIAQNPGLEK